MNFFLNFHSQRIERDSTIYIYMYIYIYTYIYVYICIYIHTHTYIYIYIYTHTRLHVNYSLLSQDFNEILILSTNFRKILKYKIS